MPSGEAFLDIDLEISCRRYGTEYGGFYVWDKVFDVREKIKTYSFGIGEDLSFSEDLFKFFSANMNIYAFDPTPRAIAYVKNHWLSKKENFHFYSFGLAPEDGKVLFHLPINKAYVSGSICKHAGVMEDGIEVQMKCLETIMECLEHGHIHLLKMDIEGAEFNIIDSWFLMLEQKNSSLDVDQIVLEPHDRFFDNGIEILKKMNIQMHQLGYVLICNYGEGLTYVKKILI